MIVAFIFTHFLPNIGGTEIPLYYYARELVKRGHKVIVITANALGYKPAKLPSTEIIDGIEVRRLRYWPVPFYKQFMFAPSLLKELLSLNVDVVVIFSLLPSFFLILPYIVMRLRGIPIVAYPQAHPRRSMYRGRFIYLLDYLFIRTIGIGMLKLADYVIALSDEERNFYNKCGIRKVAIIYEGVDHLPKHVTDEELSAFVKKYRLPSGKYIVTIGRIEKRKGLLTLIRAIPIVISEIPGAHLLIVGPDPNNLWPVYKDIIDALKCSGHIHFLGMVTDRELVCIYRLAEVVVVPSHFEALSRVILEAFYYAKPVVTTYGIAIRNIASRGGIVVPVRDYMRLARTLIKILRNPMLRRKLGEHGYKFANALTWHSRAELLEQILLRVANKNERFYNCSH